MIKKRYFYRQLLPEKAGKMENILGIAVENILVGIASGGFVGLATVVRRRYSNYRIERKYPIGGTYISKFEDENNGQVEVVTAPVTIIQKGKRIRARTEVPNENRCWILEGEISSGGHLYGAYFAEDPHDKGIGNFFLHINFNRTMEGLWSGFDSVNRKITSGKYTFIPVAEDISITDAAESDIPHIIDISDTELGKDYLNDEDLKGFFAASDCILRVAKKGGKEIVGFSFSYYAPPEAIGEKMRWENMPKKFQYSTRIGVLKTVAVRSKHKGMGIGNSLVVDAQSELGKKGVPSILTVAWKSDLGINISGIMSKNGFVPNCEIEAYWRKDSIVSGYDCPVCGNPCHCSAVIYVKTL